MLEYFESEAIPLNIDSRVIPLSYSRKRIVVNKETINHGVEAVFIPVNHIEGLKLYPSIKDGKLAHQCQVEAFHYGIGPEVFSPLREFVFPMGTARGYPILLRKFPMGKAYGYYTQVADTKKVTFNIELTAEHADLIAKCMTHLSYKVMDCHPNNVGYIGDRLVLIDFGWHTTGTPTDRTLGHFSIPVRESTPEL